MMGGYLRFRASFNLGLLHRLLRLVHCDGVFRDLGYHSRHLGPMFGQCRLQPGAAQAFLRGCDLLLHPHKIQNPLPIAPEEPCDSTHRRRGPLWSTWRLCKLRLCKLRLCKFALVMPGRSNV